MGSLGIFLLDSLASHAWPVVVSFYLCCQLATALDLSSAGPDYGPCTAEAESAQQEAHRTLCLSHSHSLARLYSYAHP